MEMADTIVINKADGDNIRKAQLAKSEFNRGLHLFPAKVRLDSYLQPAVQLHKTGFQSLGNHHEIYRTHEKQ
jgi:putative protein kinase ArgK-like GTPase of G3E family